MGFILDGLDAEAYDRHYPDRDLIRRISGYFRPLWRRMALVTAMIVLGSLLGALIPLFIATTIDASMRAPSTGAVLLLVGVILGVSALLWCINYVRQLFTAQAIGDVMLRLRHQIFMAVLAHDHAFFDKHPSGAIVSRMTSDTEGFATVITLALNLLSQLMLILIIVGVMAWIDIRLTLLAISAIPIITLAALGFRRVARRATQRAQRSTARLNAVVYESLRGIAITKNYRQEQAVYQRFQQINRQSYLVNLWQGLIFSTIFPLLLTIAGIGTTAMVYFGAQQVQAGSTSPGAWFLFVQSMGIFWVPLSGIASFWSQFQQGLAASERVFALIDAGPAVVQRDRQPVPRLSGRIELQNVDFQYTAQETVLRGFNLAIAPGETVALVGHTGSGKSTVCKLIARFYEFQHGQILVDGRDIRALDLRAYRSQIGIITQTPVLFAGTVADNIRYVYPQASVAEVAAAARRVGDGAWLEALPDGLSTPIGDQGRGISSGQRQLIALARLLLQDPAVMILDEATASVDPLTEARIQAGITMAMRGRTAIIIAHRLSTIQHVDRIIVLRQGAIVEQGSHDTLLGRGGSYAELYNTYFRHQSPDYVPGQGFVPVQAPVTR